MASGPITSWQMDGDTMETVSDFIFLGSKIAVDGNCGHKIKGRLLLGRKAMATVDSLLENRDVTLLTKVCIVKTMVFPVVMYRCESWTIKKAERGRTDAFELWCWRRLLRVLEQQGDQTSRPWRKSTVNIHWKDWGWNYSSYTLATWYEEPTHWKRPWCWKDWGQEKWETKNEMVG